MANHIKNRLEVIGTHKEVEEIFETFKTDHPAKLSRSYDDKIICKSSKEDGYNVGWFDEKTGLFSRRNEEDVLGLPEGWEFEINEAFSHFPDFEKVIPPPANIFRGNIGREEKEMCIREGRPTWYDFNRENWGTKWNCFSCKRESFFVFAFETAWSSVPVIIEAISKKFPAVSFIYEYADEDTGYNAGVYELKDGITKETIFEQGSIKAYELAFKLRPSIKEDYQLINGEYEFIEQ